MKKLFLTIIMLFLVVAVAQAKDKPTGISKLCDDIGYLSTSCKDVEVLPMEYKDKDVAIAKAQQDINEETTNIVLNLKNIVEKALEESKKKDDIEVKTWLEKE